jgi:hypothetical protein
VLSGPWRGFSWLNAIKAFGGVITVTAATIAILISVGVLSGGGDGGADLGARVEAALSRTQDAGSSRLELRMGVDDGAGATVATGMFDYRRGVGQLTAAGERAPNRIFVGDTEYFRNPAINHGRWQKKPAGQSPLGHWLAPDPSQQLAYLKRLVDPKRVGAERVFGVPTTHYAATMSALDLVPNAADLVREAEPPPLEHQFDWAWGKGDWLHPPPVIPSVLEILDALPELPPVKVEAWIDATGLVRRLKTTLVGARPVGDVWDVLELHDFGVPVRVNPPRRAQTYRVPSNLQF